MKLKYLYKFTYRNNIYRWCSGNKDITYQGQLYKCYYMSHSRIVYSVDDNLCEASIYTDDINPLVELYKDFIPTTPVYFSLHVMTSSTTAEPRYWGKVKEIIITNDYDAEIKVMPPVDTETVANRWTYQSTCNHILYSDLCTVDINNFSFLTNVTDVSEDGTEITVDNIVMPGVTDPTWLLNGRIIIESVGAASSIMGVDIAARKIILLSYFNVNIGEQIRLTAGCNRSIDHCKNKFNNLARQNAESWVPGRDPTKGL